MANYKYLAYLSMCRDIMQALDGDITLAVEGDILYNNKNRKTAERDWPEGLRRRVRYLIFISPGNISLNISDIESTSFSKLFPNLDMNCSFITGNLRRLSDSILVFVKKEENDIKTHFDKIMHVTGTLIW